MEFGDVAPLLEYLQERYTNSLSESVVTKLPPLFQHSPLFASKLCNPGVLGFLNSKNRGSRLVNTFINNSVGI